MNFINFYTSANHFQQHTRWTKMFKFFLSRLCDANCDEIAVKLLREKTRLATVQEKCTHRLYFRYMQVIHSRILWRD